MKKLLTLSIMLCSLISKGQIEYKYNQDSTTVWIRTNTTDTTAFGYTKQRNDTIPSIFLVTDTSVIRDTAQLLGNTLIFENYKNENAYWIKGYIAKVQSYICCDASGNLNAKFYWSTDNYTNLDADKKPLGKNIIVWLSKEL